MRFLLDTVTLSAFRNPAKADPSVIRWQQSLRGQTGYISVISLNEIRFGIRGVARRDPDFAAQLELWYRRILSQHDSFQILDIDTAIAEVAADFRAAHGTPFPDSLIAATAKVHGLTLATRNIADFESTGIALVNPWDACG